MKSYFLEGVVSVDAARSALRRILPGQESPWLLRSKDGDAIAYFNVTERELDVACPAVTVDMSGRHFDRVALVLSTLEQLQVLAGGRIAGDD